MSFVKKFAKHIQTTNINNLFLIRGETNDADCWYYLVVDKLKVPIFLDATKSLPQDLELTAYGDVIASGLGENPPLFVQELVKKSEIDEFTTENEIIHADTKDMGGNVFYAFVSVPKFLVVELKQKMAAGENLSLQNYGHILEWNWGKADEEKIKEYTTEHQFA